MCYDVSEDALDHAESLSDASELHELTGGCHWNKSPVKDENHTRAAFEVSPEYRSALQFH